MTHPETNALIPAGSRYFRPTRAHAPRGAQYNPSSGPHNATALPSQGFPPEVLHQYAHQRQDPLLIQPNVSPTSPKNPDLPITIVIDNATEVTGNQNFLFLPSIFARPEIVRKNTVNMVTAALKNLPNTKDREIDIGVMGGVKVNGSNNFMSCTSDLSETEKVAAMTRATRAGAQVSPVVPEVRREDTQGGNGETPATRPAGPLGGPQRAGRQHEDLQNRGHHPSKNPCIAFIRKGIGRAISTQSTSNLTSRSLNSLLPLSSRPLVSVKSQKSQNIPFPDRWALIRRGTDKSRAG
jgi:hypothetical protein